MSKYSKLSLVGNDWWCLSKFNDDKAYGRRVARGRQLIFQLTARRPTTKITTSTIARQILASVKVLPRLDEDVHCRIGCCHSHTGSLRLSKFSGDWWNPIKSKKFDSDHLLPIGIKWKHRSTTNHHPVQSQISIRNIPIDHRHFDAFFFRIEIFLVFDVVDYLRKVFRQHGFIIFVHVNFLFQDFFFVQLDVDCWIAANCEHFLKLSSSLAPLCGYRAIEKTNELRFFSFSFFIQ